jgi:hypothetical protein
VQLLVLVLPVVFEESCFALKGGTALNLFVRDMPRLSVDIDLVYLPHEGRADALPKIVSALDRVAVSLHDRFAGLDVKKAYQEKPDALRLLVRRGDVLIKIELSPVLRGTVLEPQLREICPTAQEHFGYAEVPVVSLPDLYGGKICAALDRQHPRDLFDVMLLLEADGITDPIRMATLIYLLSHPRPVEELLFPHEKDIAAIFRNEFQGMTLRAVTLDDLLSTRIRMLKSLHQGLKPDENELLLRFLKGDAFWNTSGFVGIEDLPALLWKAQNLEKMAPEKRALSVQKLEDLFAGIGRFV